MSLVAQVGHLVILCPNKVTQLTPFLIKKLSKTVKKGYPPFLPGFFQSLRALWTPHLSCDPSEVVLLPGGPSPGSKPALGAVILRWGVPGARKLLKIVYFRGGGLHLAPHSRGASEPKKTPI